MISPKLCGKCVFPQNFHNKKLHEISLFHAMHENVKLLILIHKKGSRRCYPIERIHLLINNIEILDGHNSASKKIAFVK